MKCDMLLVYGMSKGKNPKRKIIRWYHSDFNRASIPIIELKEAEICNGEIIAKVGAEEEPYFGGTSACFVLNYKCSKCGGSHFPDLPQDEYALSKFLTETIKRL